MAKTITATLNIAIFSQILSFVDRGGGRNVLVPKHDSDKHHKGIASWTHFVNMLFCHLWSTDAVKDQTVCGVRLVICNTWVSVGCPASLICPT
ncbi:DUF4372 domain-containing protein [uncultured Sphingobacterium sp.]|uniref:DUF4372 domain-containing protein n=1 Tax=uncultured Sphingobacterium sp. TaxID=182688 RepID=UPI00345BB462